MPTPIGTSLQIVRIVLVLGTALSCSNPWAPPTQVEDGHNPPEIGEQTIATEVRLLDPVDGFLVPQNNRDTGCSAHSTRGYGLKIVFAWTGPAETSGYHLFAKNRYVQFPIVDLMVHDTEFPYLACNAFVADRNLTGWEWKVRPMFTPDSTGRWSDVGEFGFAPCRLTDSMPCSAPASNSVTRWWTLP